jgi:hypothetical protein
VNLLQSGGDKFSLFFTWNAKASENGCKGGIKKIDAASKRKGKRQRYITFWYPSFAEAGSNPAEAVGFFRVKKSSARLPSEGK